MGKPTGFMEWPRRTASKRPPAERVGDFGEILVARAPEEARRQAGRCMDCGVPFCQSGCPLGNPIPDFDDLVWRDRWFDAWQRLSESNELPELTGRLCPAPCEAACVLAIDGAPVTIEDIEREIAERAFAEGWVVPRPPARRSGRRVAVVGSGPAGLTAAARLNRAGHHVTVFERDDRIGGLLRYGIPDFKLDRAVLDRRLALLRAEGVRFETCVDVGGALPWGALRADHDAVVVAIGARVPRELPVPGRELAGVTLAMPFLERQNRLLAGDADPEPALDAGGRRVVILGGGDTGSDCLGTAHRQGAAHVAQVELMPAPPPDRRADNPWPAWPLVFRTSSSQEEGGERVFARRTTHLSGRDGRLTTLHAVEVGPDHRDIPGTEVAWPVDLLVLAMGFTGPDTATLQAQLGVALDARGNVVVGPDFATSVPGVWCVGDAARGANLIVRAIADGRDAARAVGASIATPQATLADDRMCR